MTSQPSSELGRLMLPMNGHELPDPVRTADIDEDKEHGHDDGAHREEFAEDGDLLDRLPVVDVGRDDEHHRGRGDADEEGEVADVEGPGDLVAHVGRDEPVLKLVPPGGETPEADEAEKGDPGVEGRVRP